MSDAPMKTKDTEESKMFEKTGRSNETEKITRTGKSQNPPPLEKSEGKPDEKDERKTIIPRKKMVTKSIKTPISTAGKRKTSDESRTKVHGTRKEKAKHSRT